MFYRTTDFQELKERKKERKPHTPLLTGLLFEEDSTGFTFSLLAEGELCLISFATYPNKEKK